MTTILPTQGVTSSPRRLTLGRVYQPNGRISCQSSFRDNTTCLSLRFVRGNFSTEVTVRSSKILFLWFYSVLSLSLRKNQPSNVCDSSFRTTFIYTWQFKYKKTTILTPSTMNCFDKTCQDLLLETENHCYRLINWSQESSREEMHHLKPWIRFSQAVWETSTLDLFWIIHQSNLHHWTHGFSDNFMTTFLAETRIDDSCILCRLLLRNSKYHLEMRVSLTTQMMSQWDLQPIVRMQTAKFTTTQVSQLLMYQVFIDSNILVKRLSSNTWRVMQRQRFGKERQENKNKKQNQRKIEQRDLPRILLSCLVQQQRNSPSLTTKPMTKRRDRK